MKHTPWRRIMGFMGGKTYGIEDCNGKKILDMRSTEDACDILACVNACAGMEDPAKEIPALIESNREKDEQIRVKDELLDDYRNKSETLSRELYSPDFAHMLSKIVHVRCGNGVPHDIGLVLAEIIKADFSTALSTASKLKEAK